MSLPGLIIIGFGGHARSVADVALACGFGALLFVDPRARPGENFLGHPVQAAWPEGDGFGDWRAMPASGDGQRRAAQMAEARQRGRRIATLIAPTATVGVGATVAEGCFVAQHAHIGPMAAVAEGCIVNTGAAVEHEARIGAFSHISVRATVAGRAQIGAYNFIGAGATVIDRVTLADGITLGAGGVAPYDIAAPGIYVGIPARLLSKAASS
ncbi:MAG: acetyltransferase [Alphaproteobacteria bacterium]